MAGDGTLDISREIQFLVSDKLQVVSYKWLSRKFAVSSNDAKRLLQEFVDKHGSGLEVLYILYGRLKNNLHTYCIKPVSGLKLSEVKREFEDGYSVQVYSVQACIPKDPAVLWSAEFVLAEELFDEPSTNDNCLRDNRFCGVSNSFVKRIIDGKSIGIPPTQPNNDLGILASSKTNRFLQNTSASLPQPGGVQQLSPKFGPESSTIVTKEDESESGEGKAQPSKHHLDKDKVTAVHVNKKKGQNEKVPLGSGKSLANLWDRASAKAKPSNPSIYTTGDFPGDACDSVTAEAQICACEALDTVSSDDDRQDINCKRESNGGSGRKRRVVFDFSDDEDEEENVVSLASAEPPSRKPILESTESAENVVMEKRNLKFEEKKADQLKIKQEKTTESTSGFSVKEDLGGVNKSRTVGPSVSEKTQNHIPEGLPDKSKKDNEATSTSTLPKKRKVLKTRIDEKGREVTEVFWEGEVADSSNTDKVTISNGAGNRLPATNKAAPSGNVAPSNPVSKAGSKKTAKGGGKDGKQGNILAFFKKV